MEAIPSGADVYKFTQICILFEVLEAITPRGMAKPQTVPVWSLEYHLGNQV